MTFYTVKFPILNLHSIRKLLFLNVSLFKSLSALFFDLITSNFSNISETYQSKTCFQPTHCEISQYVTIMTLKISQYSPKTHQIIQSNHPQSKNYAIKVPIKHEEKKENSQQLSKKCSATSAASKLMYHPKNPVIKNLVICKTL